MSNKNLYLSLDEHGDFESNSKKRGVRYIAGLIYESNDADVKVERERIKWFYQKALESSKLDCHYPQDLHYNHKQTNKEKVLSANEQISKYLKEFFTNGSVNGAKNNDLKNREGKYHLFIEIKSPDAKKNLKDENTTNFINDNYASTLYFHMADNIVNRVICHNPLFPRGKKLNFYIDLPSRVTANAEALGDKSKQFEELGYSEVAVYQKDKTSELGYQKGKKFAVVNKDIYRTLISHELTKTNKLNININHFDVKSINYQEPKGMEFLYLCDSLCSYFSSKIVHSRIDNAMKSANVHMKRLNPNNGNLVFAYDEIDDYYEKAYSYYEKRDLLMALSTIYDAKKLTGSFATYYKKEIFPALTDKIIYAVNVDNFKKCVDSMGSNIRSNNINQSKLLYLLENIKKMEDMVTKKYSFPNDDKKRLEFEVNSYALSAYCHMGMPDEATKYYLECLKSADYITFDKLIDVRRKYAECLNDNFMFDEAYKISYDNKMYYESLMVSRNNLLNNISKKEGFISKLIETYKKPKFNGICFEYAKTVSNVARCLAYKKDKKAEAEFKLALSMMNKEDANYKITQSYLLHYYADNNMLTKFEKEATEYFGGNITYKDRLNYVESELKNTGDLFSIGFMVYILVRGHYLAGNKELSYEELDNLYKDIVASEKNTGRDFPWPIIFKYIALSNSDDYELDLIRMRQAKGKNGKTVKAITLFQELEVYKTKDDKAKMAEAVSTLEKHLKENFIIFKDKQFPKGIDKAYDELSSIFTYMTR